MSEKEIDELREQVRELYSAWQGPSYREISEACGVHYCTINRFLMGKVVPKAESLHKLREWVRSKNA